ncbi:MAG TPA: hypothetical protein VE422_08335 [Terriglobia bacterium]|nr:hypothetical protein [Terriglobia bacterium]
MRSYLAATITALAIAYAAVQLGASEPALNLSVLTHGGLTANVVLGIDDDPGLYKTQISGSSTQPHNVIHVRVERLSGEPFRVGNFSITVRVPRSSIQGIWYPSASPSSNNVMSTDTNHSIDDIADANYGIPYIGAASYNLRNVFALGLGRQDLAVSIGGKAVDGNYYEFRLKALTGITTTVFDEQFYVSADSSMNWFETAQDYTGWVDELNKYQAFPISSRAYEPLYDTWYWSGDHVDDRTYTETAELASEMGFGTFLADAGWDTPVGEYEKWLNGRTGDYRPPPDKFGNLPATFDEIRDEHGLGVNLWLQPFAVGRASTRYRVTRTTHIQIPSATNVGLGWMGLAYSPFALPLGQNLETVNLCPRVRSTQTYLKNLFVEMEGKYKPQGYWLDFLDGLATYCVAPHQHSDALFGDGFRKTLDIIKTTILSSNPDAVVQFRAKYANLNTKPFANVWQTGDSPSDFDGMRLNSMHLRPFSKGVVFAADQMYWPDSTDEVSVSRFIMTSVMVGVPAFGPTLIYSPPTTLAMLKSWLGFYKAHQTDLATGRFSLFGQLKVPNHKIEGQDLTFAYIRNLDFSELSAEGRTIFIMNATDADHFSGRIRGALGVTTYRLNVLNRYLETEANEMAVTTDRRALLNLNIGVERGGMVVLTAIDDAQPVAVDPSVVTGGAGHPQLR